MNNPDLLDFENKLATFCGDIFGQTHHVENLRRFTAGANMESWGFIYGPNKLVLRRLPTGQSDDGGLADLTLDEEAAIMDLAYKQKVKCPKILGTLEPEDELGRGILMQFIDGETLPHKIFRDPKFMGAISKLAVQCAQEMAKIHEIPVSGALKDLPRNSPQEMVRRIETILRDLNGMTPVFELAISWLLSNPPTARDPVLLHGDFRMGNLMIDETGIAAVLDWELAHIGDPAQDLAYICTPSWRFGNYDKIVGGFADPDALLSAYQAVTGLDIPMSDLNFWMVYASLGWGAGCLQMINFWRDGTDRSLERAVIGRRASETEIDIMLILEDANDLEVDKFNWELPTAKQPSGETHISELLAALETWDTDSVIPNSEGRDLFQARVARNALGMVKRLATDGARHDAEMLAALSSIELSHSDLYTLLRAGDVSGEIANYLRRDLLGRVSIDQPKYAGLKAAIGKWTHADV